MERRPPLLPQHEGGRTRVDRPHHPGPLPLPLPTALVARGVGSAVLETPGVSKHSCKHSNPHPARTRGIGPGQGQLAATSNISKRLNKETVIHVPTWRPVSQLRGCSLRQLSSWLVLEIPHPIARGSLVSVSEMVSPSSKPSRVRRHTQGEACILPRSCMTRHELVPLLFERPASTVGLSPGTWIWGGFPPLTDKRGQLSLNCKRRGPC